MRKIYPNQMNRVCKQFDVWRESIKLESFCVKWNEFGKQNCENTYDVRVAVWSKVLLVNYARKLVHIINCMVRLILREEKTHTNTKHYVCSGVVCWNFIFIDLPFSMISSVYVCLRKINATSLFNSVLFVRSLFRIFKYDQNRNFRLTAAIYHHCPRIKTILL